MTAMDSVAAKLKEYEYLLKLQMAKIEELAEENERLRSVAGAHDVLKEIYQNRDAPEGNRIKAAQAALTVEKPRLAMTAYAGKNVTDEVIIPLAEVVRLQRARAKALEGLPPDHPKYRDWVWDDDKSKWSEQVARLTGGNGDGQDDGNSGTDSSSNHS
jgi:hypothetical protein